MTHQEFDERLDEILETALNDFYDYITEKNTIKAAYEYSNKTIPKKAKQAIRELFVEVVGEDLPTDIYGSWTRRLNGSMLPLSDEVVITNKVKKQLRTTITGKEGGK